MAAIVGVHSLGRPEIVALATAVFVVQVPLLLAASLAPRRLQAPLDATRAPSRPA